MVLKSVSGSRIAGDARQISIAGRIRSVQHAEEFNAAAARASAILVTGDTERGAKFGLAVPKGPHRWDEHAGCGRGQPSIYAALNA